MRTSDQIDLIAPALLAAQSHIKPVIKDATNPAFKSRYATLDAVTEAVRQPLMDQGIVIIQGGGELGVTTTRLVHTSGQFIETIFTLPLDKTTSQGAGSASTYGRRYSLSAMLGLLTEEDDDAEATKFHQEFEPVKRSAPRPAPSGSIPSKCPKCKGPLWDNREGKKNPKSPDWKCRDKACLDPATGFVTGGWVEKDDHAPLDEEGGY